MRERSFGWRKVDHKMRFVKRAAATMQPRIARPAARTARARSDERQERLTTVSFGADGRLGKQLLDDLAHLLVRERAAVA